MACILTTPRLTLREMTDTDLEDMAELLGDTRVMQYLRSKTKDEAQAWIDWNKRLPRTQVRAMGRYCPGYGRVRRRLRTHHPKRK